jgi:hypothetical protein
MAISANTLAQTAQTLMDQLNAGSITFQQFQNSMGSIISSSNNNPEFLIDENQDASHTINVAIRISQGEAPPKRK